MGGQKGDQAGGKMKAAHVDKHDYCVRNRGVAWLVTTDGWAEDGCRQYGDVSGLAVSWFVEKKC